MKSNNIDNRDKEYIWIKLLKNSSSDITKLLASNRKSGTSPKWNEGIVHKNYDHIKISYGDDAKPIALISPDQDNNRRIK